ncbi:DUF3987 domain-containing protein [Streptomyces erythrochromogenes]|uniref:DUF3987 domain-containing protein n=1 Tax=Streptomyces erythrochromogenes TaxID=285574 RepID=UPI0036AFDAAD
MDEEARYKAMAYGPLGAAVKAAMPHTEADPLGVHAAALALFSAAINGKVMQPDGRPVVVWTALAGRSMVGRKGFALSTAEALLTDAIGEWLSLRRQGGISSGPSLVQTLFETEQDSLTSEGGLDGRTLVIDEEWPTTLQLTKRCPKYSGVLRTSWDGKRISNVTKKDGKRVEITVNEPSLGFHAHIQPALWSKYISATDAAGGSYNRILPVMVERSKRLRRRDYKTGNPLDEIKVSTSLRLAYEWACKDVRHMELSDASADRYDDIRAEYEDALEELPEDVSCFIERSGEQVMRVACVLTAAERKTVVTVKALNAAKAFVDYSVASVKQLISQSNVVKSRTIEPLDVKIRQKLEMYGGEMTSTQLYRALSSRYTAAQILNTAEDMADVVIVQEKVRRPGANPVVFRLVKVLPEPQPVEAVEPVKPPARKSVPAKKAAVPARKATAAVPPPARTRVARKAPAKTPAKKTAASTPSA